jgi:hypothetical protein
MAAVLRGEVNLYAEIRNYYYYCLGVVYGLYYLWHTRNRW